MSQLCFKAQFTVNKSLSDFMCGFALWPNARWGFERTKSNRIHHHATKCSWTTDHKA